MARIEIECRNCGAKCVTASVAEMATWDTEHNKTCVGVIDLSAGQSNG